MASFVFPSPDDIQEFEAPNGILYSWDPEDGKWVVKSTSNVGSKLDKPYVVYHGPNPPTVSVSPDGQLKDGELWYSTNTLELFVYGSDAWWPTAADVSGELSTLRVSIEQAEQDIDNNEEEIGLLKVKVDEAVNLEYANNNYLRLDGGKTTGYIEIENPSGSSDADGFTIRGTIENGSEGKLLHVFHNAGTNPDAVNYKGRTDNSSNIQTKSSVQSLIGASTTPIGAIMMWMGATAPQGWLFCRGDTFDINTYPKLHAHLQEMQGYVSGTTPDFKGLYPGGAGDGPAKLTPDKAGYVHPYRTGQPYAGPPTTSSEIPDGTTRTFNGAGGTNAYSDGKDMVSISEGWDTVTRPPTLSVNFIIKHD